MNNSIFSFLLVFVSLILSGQEPMQPPLNPTGTPNWEYDGFSYADFGTGEEHSSFSVLYKLNPTLHMELQGFYDSYRASNVFDLSYRVKWYPTNKFYIFSGVGVQLQQAKVGESQPIMPVRMLFGVGYEPKENISIEAVYDLNITGDSMSSNGSPSLFNVRGKYRF